MSEQVAAIQIPRFARGVALLGALVLVAGCESLTRPIAPAPPPPPTTLLDAGSLSLPAGCAVPPGQTYRVSYLVDVAGRAARPDDISPPEAPACLQEALRNWVATFRYAPVAQAERLTADWMLVTARRGS